VVPELSQHQSGVVRALTKSHCGMLWLAGTGLRKSDKRRRLGSLAGENGITRNTTGEFVQDKGQGGIDSTGR